MAKFRMVHTEFWSDSTVMEEFTPEDKYFYLYLLTNENTTQIGIYEITKKKMAFDMGYSMETINSLLDRFLNHHELVIYNEDTRELAIKNWGKYNLRRGGKPMIDCVRNELRNVKDAQLIKYIAQGIEHSDIKGLYDTYHDTYTIRTQEEEKEEEEEEEKEREVLDKFEEWWNLYDNKKDRKRCFTRYRNLLKEYSHEEMMKGTKEYLDHLDRLEELNMFVPQKRYPATFLNNENFNDEFVIENKNNKSEPLDWSDA